MPPLIGVTGTAPAYDRNGPFRSETDPAVNGGVVSMLVPQGAIQNPGLVANRIALFRVVFNDGLN
jgi:hypothetical protein